MAARDRARTGSSTLAPTRPSLTRSPGGVRVVLNHWLQKRESTVGRQAPFASTVRIFVMGTGDGHKTADGRVNHGGVLAQTKRNGRWRRHAVHELLPGRWRCAIARTVDRTAIVDQLQFNPRHPVPTIGGNISSGDGILVAGAWDQRGGKHICERRTDSPFGAQRRRRLSNAAA